MLRIASALVVIHVFAGNAICNDTKTDPRETLKMVIAEAIRLLENKEYEPFLKQFVAPDDLKHILKDMTMDEFVTLFGENKAHLLLRGLKGIENKEPELDKDGQKATFLFKQPIDGKKSITFVKVDSYWYIAD